MNVLFASVEVAPFAWAGGMGDVAGSLPKALRELGVDIRVIMPQHRGALDKAGAVSRAVDYCPVHMPWWVTGCAINQSVLPNSDVPIYFVEHHQYFDRDGIFGPAGGSYPDNLERFVFFCRSVLAGIEGMGWRPDVIHLNDWHTSLLALYQRSFGGDFRTAYTAHQLGRDYHGVFPTEFQWVAGIDLGRPEARQFVLDGQIDLARAGLSCAHTANTVSERYAWEVAQPGSEEGVSDLVGHLGDRFRGIINGIDYGVWNPRTDAVITQQYGPGDLAGKAACKAALQRMAGLPVDPNMPLVGMVSRLDAIKGFDIVLQALPSITGCQFVFLGTGDPRISAAVADAAAYRDDVAAFLQFDADLARQVYAGSDIFLMPSRREPAGTAQMISLKYGTIPLVFKTGGLADTVTEDPVHQNGFVFEAFSSDEMLAALWRAMDFYRDAAAWELLVDRAMACDYSWGQSAIRYVEMYEQALALDR